MRAKIALRVWYLVGINYFEQDDLDKVVPYEQTDYDLAVVTVADKSKHAEAIIKRTQCLVDMN